MTADVCLVAEGSYPYVLGGVSSWVHQLITGLPDVRFALVCVIPDPAFADQDRYKLPRNVVSRQDLCLFPPAGAAAGEARLSPGFAKAVEAMHAREGAARCPFMGQVDKLFGGDAEALLSARGSWELIQRIYRRLGRGVSFLDYYWTWRAVHAPLLRVMAASLPAARVYHAVSTGYAGFATALAQLRTGRGMVLTEHGIYVREREIEIAQAEWIYEPPVSGSAYAARDGFFHGWWRSQYQFMALLTYACSQRIVSLHGTNARIQQESGADPRKIAIVPNGIQPARFLLARQKPLRREGALEVALVGRVVPIKDVLTFLRAVHMASRDVALKAYVLGPWDEDPAYHQECLDLVRLLGLEQVVQFPGKVDVATWLERVDLIASTSISESQPLALLEAMAAGVPAIATDVGACREMLEGRPGDDALLGPSGLVVPVVTPAAVAEAIVALAADPERRAAMGASGIARVERYYTEERFLDAYRALYTELAG